MRRQINILALVSLLMYGFSTVQAQENTASGEEVVTKMYERYQNEWYDYLTFDQETIFYENGEIARSQEWFEAMAVPGKLVIKFDSLDSGTGIIFRQDSQYVFQNNQLVQQGPRVHDLLVLGFDVYNQSPARTIRTLKEQGFNLSQTYETEWQGRPVYVVGASGKDDESNQFWIDKERLYFVRLLKKNPANGTMQETQFNNYEQVGGGWVAPVVLFFTDGTLIIKEVYSNIEAPEHLEASIFDLQNFGQAEW